MLYSTGARLTVTNPAAGQRILLTDQDVSTSSEGGLPYGTRGEGSNENRG